MESNSDKTINNKMKLECWISVRKEDLHDCQSSNKKRYMSNIIEEEFVKKKKKKSNPYKYNAVA